MQAGQLVNNLSGTGTVEAEKMPVEQPKQASAASEAPTKIVEEVESNDDIEFPDIKAILSDVPPPTPIVSSGMIPLSEEDRISTRPPQSRTRTFSRETSPAMHVNEVITSNNEQTVEHVARDLDATMPSKSRKRPETPVRRPMPGELDETRPSHLPIETPGRVTLEPITPGLYNLTYACLLVPRLTTHYLTGDISDRLSEWLPQTCIAFGWRLEYLAVRPEYVQWVANVPPATSPGNLMRVMRQQTSDRIFNEFPRMKKENPSGDFWAPGYLIMGGAQPHPPQLVKDYIKQTRERQGISQPKK
jgi:REP element-mobilizing transposase RayT